MEESVPTDGDARRKRPRTNLACEGCKRRKSRCDVVIGKACHRCQQLGVECSFETAPPDSSALASLSHDAHVGLAPPIIDGSSEWSGRIADPSRLPSQAGAQRPADGGPNGSASADDAGRRSEILSLRARLASLETSLSPSGTLQASKDQLAVPSSASEKIPSFTSTSNAQQESSAAPEIRDEAWYRAFSAPEDFSLIHGGLRSMAEVGLRDPVADGVIPLSHAEMVYQLFKHHISGILPYRPLLMTRSRLPPHPFLRVACLVYASRCIPPDTLLSSSQIRDLEANVGQNILAYQYGCRASLEGVLAALILSYLPYGHTSEPNIAYDIDAPRMAGLAWGTLREYGSTIFFERIVDLMEGDTPTAHLSETLDNARLHLCVIIRVCWTNLSACPSNDLPTALNDTHRRFLQLLETRSAVTELDRHLMFEYRALDICTAQAQSLRRLERILTPSSAELRRGNDGARGAMQQLDELRRRAAQEASDNASLPSLLCQISYSKWWIGIRNIWFGYRIPTPLITQSVYNELLDGMILAGQASADMINLCVKEAWDLAGLPKTIVNAIVLCFYTLSMGLAHLSHHYADQNPPTWLLVTDSLKSVQTVLSESRPAFQYMLRKAQTTLEEYNRQLQLERLNPPPSVVVGGDAFANDAMPFNFNLDHSGLGVDGIRMEDFGGSGYNSRGELANVLHWDPFMELGHGWEWQQSTFFPPDGFWNRV